MTTSVSVGVCAYNEEKRLPRLLDSVRSQSISPAYAIREILVVASGCTDGTVGVVESALAKDPRVRLIREPVRLGKASAINLLLAQYTGDVLVLVNGDAELGPGSLAQLLGAFEEEPQAQVACGSVVLADRPPSLHSVLEEMQWWVHNRSLEILSDLHADNHCCDEFMAIRRGFLTALPPDLINDGAYIGVVASLQGQSVRFRPGAKVLIETPRTVRGVVQQRIRILRGHKQVRRLLGRRPNTIEGLATRRPDLAVRLLGGTFRDRPFSVLPFLVVTLPVEMYANAVAFLQDITSDHDDPAWVPVD